MRNRVLAAVLLAALANSTATQAETAPRSPKLLRQTLEISVDPSGAMSITCPPKIRKFGPMDHFTKTKNEPRVKGTLPLVYDTGDIDLRQFENTGGYEYATDIVFVLTKGTFDRKTPIVLTGPNVATQFPQKDITVDATGKVLHIVDANTDGGVYHYSLQGADGPLEHGVQHGRRRWVIDPSIINRGPG